MLVIDHFIINELAANCIGENMEKYVTFFVPIKEKCDYSKTITYKLRFIDSFRFMITCLETLIVQNANHARKIMDAKNANRRTSRRTS